MPLLDGSAYSRDMTTSVNPDGAAWVPADACTLPRADQPLRVAEFDNLFRAHLDGVEQMSRTRARLSFSGGRAVREKVSRLTAQESACCSFFTFDITAATFEVVVLDVQVPEAHADVLAGLVSRARVMKREGVS